MTTPTKRPRALSTVVAGIAAVGACAVCCAGPLLAFFGGLSLVSLAASIWVPALALVAVAALAGAVWILRRRRTSSCRIGDGDAAGPVELGMPTATRSSPQSADRSGPSR